MDEDRIIKPTWRVWLKMDDGTQKPVPLPADNEEGAKILAHEAEKYLGGTIMDIEQLT